MDIMGIYLNPGKAEHAGKVWIGYTVERTEVLTALQAEVTKSLHSAGAEILTGTGSAYFPHFTLARFPEHFAAEHFPAFDIKEFLRSPLPDVSIPCLVKFGASDENGQFLRVF